MGRLYQEYLGEVFVDAGIIWVGDPCYVMGKDSSHGPENWAEFCQKLFGETDRNIEPLGEGVGFCVDTTFGDGSYPVYIEYDDMGRRSIRVELE